jgi:hypothetical protein
MVVDDSGRVASAYQANATPFSYFLDYEGRVLMRGIANDWRGLESILEQEGTLEAGRSWKSVKPGESTESPADSVNAVVESKGRD